MVVVPETSPSLAVVVVVSSFAGMTVVSPPLPSLAVVVVVSSFAGMTVVSPPLPCGSPVVPPLSPVWMAAGVTTLILYEEMCSELHVSVLGQNQYIS